MMPHFAFTTLAVVVELRTIHRRSDLSERYDALQLSATTSRSRVDFASGYST
jgi:hypothetical protein